MAKEIERKFLVVNDSFLSAEIKRVDIVQGYLSTDPDRTVRIRCAAEKAFLTVKTRNSGAVRNEWEFEIPADRAREMLETVKCPVICKTRFYVRAVDGHIWEIDCFHGRLEGLKLAEIELEAEDESFEIPEFAGDEVTSDPRYYNSNLVDQA